MASHRTRRRRSKKSENEVYDYSKLDRKVFQALGKRPVPQDFAIVAGQRTGAASLWLPMLLSVGRVACVVSILSLFATLFFIERWPKPTLLLSFPDGTVRCAPAPLDPATGKPLPRSSPHEARLCAALENYGGNRDTGDQE